MVGQLTNLMLLLKMYNVMLGSLRSLLVLNRNQLAAC
ncbi:hypothetical protein PssvBMR4_gp55 [Pseudomonas phage MR4]|uniref:Uncharacterized protein n=1 Tax=Pseudomonas phage MR4 TaxID=2711171 RepID=A0A6M3TCL5_9CAUD|nr:hypothetical protein PssvBMR4_gp55 [Pseudomonas phage MR4]